MKHPIENESAPVAVIAVHGVADQSKDETALKAVDLLLHHNGTEETGTGETPLTQRYEGFEEEKVHVGIKPLDVSSVTDEDAWHYQLRKHLEDYKGGQRREVFETLRLEGERLTRGEPGGAPKADRKVHIYEMHWADVSNLKFGIFNLFVAIYRLLFESSWLGKQTIGKWASFGDDVGRFSTITSLRGILLFLHTTATFVLTRFMPVIYLFMIFMIAMTGLPILESKWAAGVLNGLGGYPGLFTLSVAALVGIAFIGVAYAFWRRIPWPPIFLIIVVACFLAANIVLAFLHGREGTWWAEAGLALTIWIGFGLLVNALFLPALNRRFPGTRLIGNLLLIFFTIGLALGLVHTSDWPMLISGPIQALRFGSALMPLAWIILAVAANLFLILAMLSLFTLWFRRGLGKEVIRRKRSRLRTAVISITIPVLLISFLNATFFQLALIPAKLGVLNGVQPIENRTADAPEAIKGLEDWLHENVQPVVARWSAVPDFEEWSEENSGRGVVFSDYAKFASSEMVVPFLEVIFLIVIIVLGYSLWIVTPAILAERKRLVNSGDKKWEKLSVSLGKNLTQGYSWIWLGQVILVVCLLATQILFGCRAARSAQLRAGDGNNESPVMVLVDQFLGLRNAEMNAPPVEVAARSHRHGDRFSKGRPKGRNVGKSAAQYEGKHPHFQRDTANKRARIRESIQEMIQQRRPDALKKKDVPSELPKAPDPTATARAPTAPTAVPAIQPDSKPEPTMVVNLITETIAFFTNGPITNALGITILIVALGYFFFSRITDPLVSGLRGGLDVALDIVSYLHPFPKNRTTRARILSRYASLLKYIVDWRDPNDPGTGYSRIVILTHSQGSVITSDLLRALSAGTVARDNGLENLSVPSSGKEHHVPVRLLTMGSPLVQLYRARFPDLYDLDQNADPRESHRGLESWWNLYRSGDYVGRMIFRDLKDKSNYLPSVDYTLNADGKSVPVWETCIGPGAHTHYWGEHAPPSVVKKFDYLIASDQIEDPEPDEVPSEPVAVAPQLSSDSPDRPGAEDA